ncbi:MepB family protein [Xenorhabdus bharatensis]|uniref:MepB family protein n=1 Tax=Xenorhabdus bharatensis TaxID=3136256 RepID=UPI0030F43EAB
MLSLSHEKNSLPDSFNEIYQSLLLPTGAHLSSHPYRENESHDYDAMRFGIDGKSIIFRQAKITPRKIGQFVTLWKRPSPNAEIMPLDAKDNIDFCLIATFTEDKKGIFLFDSDILIKKGVFSSGTKEGKRAIRIYPSWDFPDSKQATQTQKWQSSYFINLDNPLAAIEKLKNILSN